LLLSLYFHFQAGQRYFYKVAPVSAETGTLLQMCVEIIQCPLPMAPKDNQCLCCSCLREEKKTAADACLCPAAQSYIMFKIGCAWAILGGLGGPLGSTAISPKTKYGKSMALFARIMFLEI
jgi:hypothetical protein